MSKKNNSKKIIQRVLTLLIIICLGSAGYLLYDYFQDKERQYNNAEVALVRANDIIRSKKDVRKEKPAIGTVIGKIRVEGVTEDLPIIEGDSLQDSMAHGVGHIQDTPMPGTYDGKSDVLASTFSAHRETFFKDLKNVKEGDIVVVSMPYATYRYKITGSIITGTGAKSAAKIYNTNSNGKERVALITCYPFEAWTNPSKRITFFGDLIE